MKTLMRALVLICACATAVANGETPYPTKPVRVLVPFTAGTNTDLVARMLARQLAERMHEPFVVENRGGAGGILASQMLLAAPADGYTLILVSSAHVANPSLKKSLPYDTVRDFSGIAMIGESPTVVAVHPSIGVHTQADLIALAKKLATGGKPPLAFSSPGIGSASDFACEYFAAEAGIKMQQVPFRGSEYVTELLSGRVKVACPPVGLAEPYIKSKQIIPLSVSGRERLPTLPNVPTAIEAGLPNYTFSIWYGLLASSKTPRPIIDAIARQVSAVAKSKAFVDALAKQGIVPADVTTSAFDKLIREDIGKLHKVAQASGIQPN